MSNFKGIFIFIVVLYCSEAYVVYKVKKGTADIGKNKEFNDLV